MTADRMALIEAINKAEDGDFLRALAETVLQIIMDADVEALIGAGRHERSVTADTDLRLARYFGLSEGVLLGLQND